MNSGKLPTAPAAPRRQTELDRGPQLLPRFGNDDAEQSISELLIFLTGIVAGAATSHLVKAPWWAQAALWLAVSSLVYVPLRWLFRRLAQRVGERRLGHVVWRMMRTGWLALASWLLIGAAIWSVNGAPPGLVWMIPLGVVLFAFWWFVVEWWRTTSPTYMPPD